MLNVFNIIIMTTLFIIGLFTIISWHYWNNKYYKDIKFQIFAPYITGVATVLICFGIIFQVSSYLQQAVEDKIKVYSELNQSFLQPILDLFLQYPEMDYYYNDLFGIKKMSPNVKRNITLENQISMVIFAKIAIPAVYIELSGDKDTVELTNKGLKKILDTFMKCKIFVEYYKTYFKPKIAGPVVVKYLEEQYNI
jgi:hypothetical protein